MLLSGGLATRTPTQKTWRTVEVLGYLLLCLIWSTTWQAIRSCLTGSPPFFGAGLRFLGAVVVLLGVLAVQRRLLRLPGGLWQHLMFLIAGVVNGFGYALVYQAETQLTGGTTAIICATGPLFTAIAARLFGLEPLRLRRVAGMSIGLVGVGFLFWEGQTFGAAQVYAMVFALLAAAVVWPVYGALLKRHAQDVATLVSTLYFLFYSAVCLLLLSCLRQEPWTKFLEAPWQAHGALVFLAIWGSVVAWGVYLWLLRRLELSVLSTIGLVQPVLALVLDWVLEQQQLGPRGYVGVLLVLLAMALSLAPLHRLRTRTNPSTPSTPSTMTKTSTLDSRDQTVGDANPEHEPPPG